jgi:hypothetical protein
MDTGLLTGVVFLDLKKAFDTVDVDILLHKLSDIGVDDIVYQWFHDYLKTRRQSFFLNNAYRLWGSSRLYTRSPYLYHVHEWFTKSTNKY